MVAQQSSFPFIGVGWIRPIMAENIANDPIDLIVRAQRGSPEATGALYLLYQQSVYRYLFYRTGDARVAEDLTSDVFLRMVQALPSYRIENTPIKAWLFQIARNIVIDFYRRSSSHRVVGIDENMDFESYDMERTIDNHLTKTDIGKALTALDGIQRDVLALRFLEGLSIAEVARILHKTEDAVKAIQRRGLVALRILIDPEELNHARL